MPNWENTTVEQLQSEMSDLEKLLKELETKTFSDAEREKKEKDAKSKAEKLQWQIDALSKQEWIDEKLREVRDTAKIVLASCNDTLNLQLNIWEQAGDKAKSWTSDNPWTSVDSTITTWTTEWSEKWFWWKTWDWVWEQWSDVTSRDKRKEQPWQNALRFIWWLWIWLAWYGIYKWVKKLWNRAFWKDKDKDKEKSKDKEEDEKGKDKETDKDKNETSWWKKFLIWAWITVWTTIWGVELYKHWNKVSSWVKEKLWLALPFDEAMQKVEAEVLNWKIDDDHFWVFNAHFEWWLTYDENTQELCSYWERTKIDKGAKKLDWLEIEFPSWEEMMHAANIVNFAKRMLKWRWASATPFAQTEWWWDLGFTCSESWKKEFLWMNNSNERSWILWTLWVAWWWILWSYCAWVHWAAIWAVWGWAWWYALWAYIDNSSAAWRCCWTIARWVNFDLFKNYLNRQKDGNWKSLWEQWEEVYKPDNESPIHKYLNEVKKEIDESYGDEDSKRRNLEVEWDESNPKEYKICSYNHKLKMTIEWWPTKKWEVIDCNKIKKIHIEKYDEYGSRWDWLDIDFPHNEEWLKEAIKTANLTNKIVEDWKWKWWEKYPFAYWRYKSPFNLDMDTDWNWWTTIVSHSMLKERYPTILEDLTEYPYVRWVFWVQKEMHDQAVHDKPEGSQYIKFLHQIGQWKFWKKIW